MKKQIALFTFGLFILTFGANAQNENWTTKVSQVGNTKVQYFISQQDSPKGEPTQTIEYVVSRVLEADIDACLEVLKTPSNYMNIFDFTEKSELIEQISENEWFVYFYIDSPWPLPNQDQVSKFTLESNGNSATIRSTSTPDKISRTDVTRAIMADFDYFLVKMNDGLLEITIKAKFQPTTAAPHFLINIWFPDGPANMIDRIAKLAKKQ